MKAAISSASGARSPCSDVVYRSFLSQVSYLGSRSIWIFIPGQLPWKPYSLSVGASTADLRLQRLRCLCRAAQQTASLQYPPLPASSTQIDPVMQNIPADVERFLPVLPGYPSRLASPMPVFPSAVYLPVWLCVGLSGCPYLYLVLVSRTVYVRIPSE